VASGPWPHSLTPKSKQGSNRAYIGSAKPLPEALPKQFPRLGFIEPTRRKAGSRSRYSCTLRHASRHSIGSPKGPSRATVKRRPGAVTRALAGLPKKAG